MSNASATLEKMTSREAAAETVTSMIGFSRRNTAPASMAHRTQTTAADLVDLLPHVATTLLFIWITWSIWSFFKPRNQHSLRSVAIVILGDVGRSPRMMYHAQSFAENNFVTDIIGYGGTYITLLCFN